MPIDHAIANDQWYRYVYLRDNGHLDFIEKANNCDANYLGNQWRREDKALLDLQRRPALTINKVKGTVDTIGGEQVNTRVDFSFKPRRPGGEDLSSVIEQVFKVILDSNQYQWKETEMAEDGWICSRGYLDVRLQFRNNMQGEVDIAVLNPRNVMPDCDAEEYDPDTWNDIVITKWLSPLDIELLYNKDDADYLRLNDPAEYSQEFDSVVRQFETFRSSPHYRSIVPTNQEMRRDVRVIERQFRQLTKRKFFVDIETGDMREIPDGWTREHIGIAMKNYRLGVVENLVKRIKWRVTAGPCVLHDDWSPYEHFTPVPYFPTFRRGKTSGVVEHLLGPQEYLNKITSQELHVINTTANSGWKLKSGSLRNMGIAELEQRGAQTGIVLELADVKDAEKIQPNTVPTGLDRLSFKAEEYIKSISTVSDNAQGLDREDVAAKAINAKRAVNVTSRARLTDNLNRTRWLLARNILSCVQRYYSEPRIYRIVKDEFTGEQGELAVNQFDEATGKITNDLTLGEYDVVITTTPNKDTIMESEFDQALAMRQEGINVPDEVLIKNSNLKSKRDIIKSMQAAANSPEAQAQKQLTGQAQQLELQRMDSENSRIQADALLKTANAKARIAEVGAEGGGGTPENPMLEQQRMAHEAAMQAADHAHDQTTQAADHAHEVQIKGAEQFHAAEMKGAEQDHGQGMARLGHSQEIQKGAVGHKQAIEQQDKQHKNSLQQTRVAASVKPKVKPKEKK